MRADHNHIHIDERMHVYGQLQREQEHILKLLEARTQRVTRRGLDEQ